jgi:hypothetical protein
MIENQIIISKDEILSKYSNLNKKVVDIIKILYSIDEYNKKYELIDDGNIKEYKIHNDFLINAKNNEELTKYKNKTGVYIFLKDNIPVYIGFSGQIDKEQSLYERIVTKHFSSNDGFVKKIKKVERYLNQNISLSDNRHQLILEFTSSIIVIDCGEKIDDNVKFAQVLEVILISLLYSKYNG